MILRWLPALILVAGAGCAWWRTGSLYRDPCTHLGARPASDARDDWAVTVQVTTDAPTCRQVYPHAHR